MVRSRSEMGVMYEALEDDGSRGFVSLLLAAEVEDCFDWWSEEPLVDEDEEDDTVVAANDLTR